MYIRTYLDVLYHGYFQTDIKLQIAPTVCRLQKKHLYVVVKNKMAYLFNLSSEGKFSVGHAKPWKFQKVNNYNSSGFWVPLWKNQ